MVLSLEQKASAVNQSAGMGIENTFQSFASRCSINGSSGSLISPTSSSSTFLTFS